MLSFLYILASGLHMMQENFTPSPSSTSSLHFGPPKVSRKQKSLGLLCVEIHVNIPNQFLISHFLPSGTKSGNLDINFLLKRPSDFCFLDTLGGAKCNKNVKEDLGVKFSCTINGRIPYFLRISIIKYLFNIYSLCSSFWSTYDARKLHSKSFLYKFVAFWTPQSLQKTKVTGSFMREIHVKVP